ncbi:uncharacterized [Tachysurus ichikawai]
MKKTAHETPEGPSVFVSILFLGICCDFVDGCGVWTILTPTRPCCCHTREAVRRQMSIRNALGEYVKASLLIILR